MDKNEELIQNPILRTLKHLKCIKMLVKLWFWKFETIGECDIIDVNVIPNRWQRTHTNTKMNFLAQLEFVNPFKNYNSDEIVLF